MTFQHLKCLHFRVDVDQCQTRQTVIRHGAEVSLQHLHGTESSLCRACCQWQNAADAQQRNMLVSRGGMMSSACSGVDTWLSSDCIHGGLHLQTTLATDTGDSCQQRQSSCKTMTDGISATNLSSVS